MIRKILLIHLFFNITSLLPNNAEKSSTFEMLVFHDKNVEEMDKMLLEHFNSNDENGVEIKNSKTIRDLYNLWSAILLKIKQFWMLKDGSKEKVDEVKEIYTKMLQRLVDKMQQPEPVSS